MKELRSAQTAPLACCGKGIEIRTIFWKIKKSKES